MGFIRFVLIISYGHSCASLLLANGNSHKKIRFWLGHSNFATTANIYASLDMSSKQAFVATIAGCLALNPSASQE
jgi:integrase